MNAKLKQTLKLGHRYLGLILAPLLLVILLSGAVLALKPIMAPEAGVGIQASISANQVMATLSQIDPAGEMSSLTVLQGGDTILLQGGKQGPEGGVYDLRSAEKVGDAGMGMQTFNWFKSLHKNLLIGAGWVVEWVSYLLAAILLVGVFLLRPKFRQTLVDTHNTLGWLALPLWLLLPVTGVMMCLHLGAPDFNQLQASSAPLAQVIKAVADDRALTQLASIETVKGRYQVVKLEEAGQVTSYQLNEQAQLSPATMNRYWAKELHEGTWAGAFSGWLNLFVSLGLVVLTSTGAYSWLRRQRQSRHKQVRRDETILVAFASQTGTAAALAKHTAAALRAAGQGVVCNPLSSVSPAELNGYEQVLLIVSTTGEGDLPEQAKAFAAAVPSHDLTQTHYAVLALGDRRYAHFCQAGKDIDALLAAQGAQCLQATAYADGNPNDVWQQWLAQFSAQLGLALAPVAKMVQDQPIGLTLMHKQRLDCVGVAGMREVWQLDFAAPADSGFRPGDLLLVTANAAARPRVYSIGSSHRVGQVLSLTVGLEQFDDGQGNIGYGLCSHYLCRELAVGASIQAALREHADFHPPQDAQQKAILIATGTGIAAYPGFMAERVQQQSQGQTWLFFGNRCHNGDYFYAEQLQGWQAQGVLAHLTTAFSADADDGEYVQHKMLAHSAELYQWLQQGAVVYVCGKANTVGEGAMTALAAIYQREAGASAAAAQAWLVELQAQQRIKMDLFG
ncbi:MAG: PepSY domain-containing protein [Neisseriaceae bacterium]|nr:PepSY domain-containing protein [Neisseriaceae bacterium]